MSKVLKQFDIYLYMQNTFDYDTCEQLWPNDTEHYWQKWEKCDGNFLNFLSMLDDMNRKHVINRLYKMYLE